jgi:hypothetical protein
MLFNTPEISDATEFEMLSPGEYFAEVIASELKDTKAGTGKYMRVDFLVGPNKQRITSFFNVENASSKAQQIGRAQFKRLLSALGITKALNLPTEFETAAHFKTLFVVVDQEVNTAGRTHNIITKFLSKKEGGKATSAQAAQIDDDMNTVPF